MEHDSDGEINCNWYVRNGHQRTCTGTLGLGNNWMNGNHPYNSIIEISQNTEKSPGNLRSPSEKPSADAGVKNSLESKIIIETGDYRINS